MKINRVGQTARNSTSLQRAPGAPTLSVKGDPTNYPFWPGYKDYNETSVSRNLNNLTSSQASLKPRFSTKKQSCNSNHAHLIAIVQACSMAATYMCMGPY